MFLPHCNIIIKDLIKNARKKILGLCNFHLHRGGAKLNTEELVSIINAVDHDK